MADAAVQRLAEIVTTGTQLVNAPICDLTSVQAASWRGRAVNGN
jgi:hypothetical protein